MHPKPEQIHLKLLTPALKIHRLAEEILRGAYGEFSHEYADEMQDDVESIFEHSEYLSTLFQKYHDAPERVLLLDEEYQTRVCMNAIYGWSEVLMMGLVGDVSPEQQDIFTDIKNTTVYLISQVNNLLNYERCKQEQPLLTPSNAPMTLQDFYPEGIEPYRQKFPLEVHYQGDFSQKFAFNDALIASLEFLLDNVAKHTKAKLVTLRMHNAGNSVRIQLEDDGMGILLPEHPEQVFEPFFQVNTGVDGLGLGLFLTKQQIEAHRGSIRMQSTPGAGCTFMIALPVL